MHYRKDIITSIPALCLFAGLNSAQRTADYFGVSLRTWQRWEKSGTLKDCQLDALQARAGFIAVPGWEGFTISGDRIYSPGGDFSTRHEIKNMWLYRQIKEHNERSTDPQLQLF